MWCNGAGRAGTRQLNTTAALVDEWLFVSRIRLMVLLGEAASKRGRISSDDDVPAGRAGREQEEKADDVWQVKWLEKSPRSHGRAGDEEKEKN